MNCRNIAREVCRRTSGVAIAVVVAVLCAAAPPCAQDAAPDDAPAIKMPLTFNKVWFREKKKKGLAKIRAFKHSGLLTITEDGLDFVSAKDSYFFPIEDVQMLSYGKLGKDVNTDWAVLSIRQEGTIRVVGLRDGHAWGYGEETLTIYTKLREAFKLLEAGPYRHPEGYRVYDRLRHQVVLVYPEDWNAFVVRAVFVSEGAAYGRVVFSPREIESLADELGRERALPSVESGAELAVIFDRAQVGPGMSCKALKSNAREAILDQIARSPVLAEAATIIEPPTATEDTIAGCAALRIMARAKNAGGTEVVVEGRVFAHDGALFVLGTRVPVDLVEQATEILDVMVGSIRLPVASGGEF